MRTENNPTNSIQSGTLTAKVQGLNLANQLFSVGSGDQSFNQILSSQVQSRQDVKASQADSDTSARCHGAKQGPESGKGLPDDKRLEQQQRAEQEAHDVRAEDRRTENRLTEDRRLEQQRDAKADRGAAAEEQARGDQVREDERSDDQLQAESRLEAAQSNACECSDPVDSEAMESAAPTLDTVESEPEDVVDADLQAGDEPASESAPEEAGNSEAEDLRVAGKSDVAESGRAEDILASGDDQNEAVSDELAGVAPSESKEPEQSSQTEEGVLEASDPEVQVVLNPEASGGQNEPAKPGPADDAKLSRDGAASMAATLQAAKQQQSASPKSAADGSSVMTQASDESQDMPVFEPKAEKKSELGLLADRFTQKPAPGEVAPTPVQERLAALAKALDKVGSSNNSQPVSKAAEQVDSVKATPFQRSLEQVGRAVAGAKPPIATMQAPMQSREWGSEMAQRLVMMVSTKLNSAKIQLNPQEMGSIDVKVSVKHDQAHVVFTSQVAPTRDALEQAIPRLREMMEQNGVALGDVDVRDQDARESHEQRSQNQRQSGPVADGGSSVEEASTSNTDGAVAVGLVDYYA
ncbi:MAG: hypothetical protein D9N11_10200 [Ketobacter sp.]|nr:MAG: hypothetical protein D9N11_10200 [Ketobacter sp.]